MTDPPKASTPDTPGFSPEAIDAAASVMYDRVKTVPTLTFDIAYPSEQEDFRRVARGMVAAYLSASGLLAALEAAEKERDEATAALSGAIDGTNDLLDTLLRAEKARAVRTTANAIREAGRR